jgi:hypothetical protein
MSMTAWRVERGGEPSFLGLMISPGLSNMLNERLYCFLGLMKGLEGLRQCPVIGEPVRLQPPPFRLPK